MMYNQEKQNNNLTLKSKEVSDPSMLLQLEYKIVFIPKKNDKKKKRTPKVIHILVPCELIGYL